MFKHVGRHTAMIALASSALSVGSAQAQMGSIDESTVASNREIVVTATGRNSASSSTKTDTPIIELPQTISIVSRNEMDVRAVSSVSDALTYVAGVQAQSFGIDSRVDEVSVRGFGAGGFSSNNNFVDGLRLPTGGQWTRPSFDPFGLQQAEVLKGPSSVLYGQTAPGGIVNLVTRRPQFQATGELLAQTQGFTDLGHRRSQFGFDVTGPFTDSMALRFTGLLASGETQPDEVRNRRIYAAPSVTFRPGSHTSWTLLGQYQRDEGAATFQFLPALGSLNSTNGRRIALTSYLGEPDWNRFDRTQELAASFFEHRFSDSFALRNNSRYTHLDTLYRVVVLAGDTLTVCPTTLVGCIPGQTIQRRAVQGVGYSNGVTTDTQAELKLATGPVRHTILGGVDYFRTSWQHQRDQVAPALVLPLLNILDPVARGARGYEAGLSPQIYSRVISKQTGTYLQDQVALGGLRVAIGGRYDWASDDITNQVSGRRFDVKSHKFTWRAGGVYLFDFGLAPYASYSESFLPLQNDPSTNLTGEAFQPTTGQQFEAGLRFQPRGRNLYVTFSAYQIKQQNLLTPAPAGTPLCGTTTCQVQTGEGRFRGLELEGRASLRDGLTIIATATRIDAEVTKSNTASQIGKTLPQVPDWQASLFLNYRKPSGLLAGLGGGGGVRYVGESFGDTANTLAIPHYTVADIFLRYEFGSARSGVGPSISINATNVFNKTFVSTCTATSACYWGQGRVVTGRVQYRW